MTRRRFVPIASVIAVGGGGVLLRFGRGPGAPASLRVAGRRLPVDQVVATIGPAATARRRSRFDRAGELLAPPSLPSAPCIWRVSIGWRGGPINDSARA